jgi:ADP-ribose pyrophosphatase YjhB (NUDIX family)
MTATKKLSSTNHNPNWTLFVQGVEVKGEWRVVSPFGSVETAVVVSQNGEPSFDRPTYRETPHVNCVVWGRDVDGVAKFAVLRQPRPHADDPERPGDEHPPVVFGQVPMGFLDRVIGRDQLLRYENVEQGASRESAEEAGVRLVVNIERPNYPLQNPNPTFVATWADIVFVEVDLKTIGEMKADSTEPILSAEYVTATELFRRIAMGKDEEGAVYRGCTSNSVWMIFFATHPEFLPR